MLAIFIISYTALFNELGKYSCIISKLMGGIRVPSEIFMHTFEYQRMYNAVKVSRSFTEMIH